jgi:hypothetical protein
VSVIRNGRKILNPANLGISAACPSSSVSHGELVAAKIIINVYSSWGVYNPGIPSFPF